MNRPLLFKALLIVSLMFNAVIGGVILSHYHSRHNYKAAGPEMMLEHLTQRLTDRDAVIIRQVFDEKESEFDAKKQNMKTSFSDVNAAMKAVPFDQQLLREKMDKAQQARTQFDAVFENTILEAAPRLTPEGRAALFSNHP